MNLILLALLAVTEAPPTPFPTSIKGEAPPDHVVRLYVLEEDARSSGTGVLIANDLVITCNHVIKDKTKDSQVEVQFCNWDVVVAKVESVSAEYDLALLRLTSPREESPLPPGKLALNDTVTIQGYGYGPYLAQTGSYYVNDKTGKWGLIKGAQARSGDSGGAVVKDDTLVGILWGARPNETWFTPIGNIGVAFPELKKIEEEPQPYVVEDLDYSL